MHYLRLILMLLLFAAAIMITVPRRIFEFEKSQAVAHQYDLQLAELKNLKIVTAPHVDTTSPQYLQAVEDLAWTFWQEGKFTDAESWFKILLADRKRALGKDYDPKYVKAMICLAGVYRDWGHYYQSDGVYKDIQSYEQKFFKSPDIHLARDFSNISLICYLEASAATDPKVKAVRLESASAFSHSAEDEYQKIKREKHLNTDREIGNVLATRYYILRDMGLVQDANETKKKADAILSAANNPAIEP